MVETTLLTLAGGFWVSLPAAAESVFCVCWARIAFHSVAHIAFDARLARSPFGSIVLGIALTLPIAWFNLRTISAAAIQSETRGGTPSRVSQRLRHGFVVAQIAMALVLLTGQGCSGSVLKQVMSVSPGLMPDHVLTGQISLPWNKLPGLAGSSRVQRAAVERDRPPTGSAGRGVRTICR